MSSASIWERHVDMLNGSKSDTEEFATRGMYTIAIPSLVRRSCSSNSSKFAERSSSFEEPIQIAQPLSRVSASSGTGRFWSLLWLWSCRPACSEISSSWAFAKDRVVLFLLSIRTSFGSEPPISWASRPFPPLFRYVGHLAPLGHFERPRFLAYSNVRL